MTAFNLKAFTLLATLVISAQESPSADPMPEVHVLDARPEKQKTNGVESLSTRRCAYGSRRVGDKAYGRDRIALLIEVISNSFPSLSGHQIAVKNYTIHHNVSTDARRMAHQMTGGLVGGAIGGAIAASRKPPEGGSIIGCSPDDLLGGYTNGEGGIVNSPIVTVIDLEVDGRTFHFRSVSDTYMPGDNGRSRRETGEANFQRAQSETIARFVPELAIFLQNTTDGR